MSAITYKEYQRKTLKFWKGKKVRTLREMRNGVHVIPQGTILEITDKHGGFSLHKVDTCDKCGIGTQVYITRVGPTSLELLEQTDDQN